MTDPSVPHAPGESTDASPADVPRKRDAAEAAGAPSGAARRLTDLYRLLVETVRDYAIFALDASGHILSWNAGAQRLKGYLPAEIIGQHFSIFYPPEDKAARKPEWELEVAARDGRIEDEGWRVRKDGSRFWANVVITALRDEAGRLVGFAKVTRDLTERREAHERAIADARRLAAEETARVAAEERSRALSDLLEQLRVQARELDRQREKADQANRAKGEFLTMMSHELRTPLNAIGGFADLMSMGLRGPVTEAQSQDLERIRRSQQHLLAIINDILNFAQVEGGRVNYEIERMRVREVVQSVEQMVAGQAVAKGVAFERATCPPDVIALADRAKTEQILLNLCTNAIKFTAPGGRLTLACRVDDDEVAIEVRDTGRGIPAERLQEIFEPFVQLGRSLSHAIEGTGLGLAISRDLARAMGGELSVVSTVGAGSIFTLSLPRARSAGENGPESASAQSLHNPP